MGKDSVRGKQTVVRSQLLECSGVSWACLTCGIRLICLQTLYRHWVSHFFTLCMCVSPYVLSIHSFHNYINDWRDPGFHLRSHMTFLIDKYNESRVPGRVSLLGPIGFVVIEQSTLCQLALRDS